MPMFSQLLAFLLRTRTFLLALVCGLLLTGWLAFWITSQIRRDASVELSQATELAVFQIEARLKEQAGVLRGLQAAFYATPSLPRQTFTEILENQNILFRLPGFVAIGFSRLLAQEQLNDFVSGIQQKNDLPPSFPSYAVHPETGQSRLQPIEYLYPLNTSTASHLGLDLLSFPANRNVLAISREDGRAMTTPPYRLSEQADAPYGFMMHFPVYLRDAAPPRASGQQSRYLGSLTAIYRVDQLLSTLDLSHPANIGRIRIHDTGGTPDRQMRQPATLLYEKVNDKETSHSAWLCSSKLINLPARQWRLEMCATPWQIVPQDKNKPWIIWLSGTVISLLVGFVLQSQTRAADLAQQLANDTTANVRKEETHQRKLAMLAHSTGDMIVIRDPRGQIQYANPAAQQHFGHENQPLAGSSSPLLLSAEAGVLTEPVQSCCSHHDIHGAVRHYAATLIPLYDPYGQYEGSILQARDITQDHEQNRSLREANERLHEWLALSSDLIWEHDPDGHITEISGNFLKEHSFPPAWLPGSEPREPTRLVSAEEDWTRYCKLIETRQPYREFIFTLTIGHASWIISLSGKPVYDASGYFSGYRGTGRDITTAHRACIQAQTVNHRLMAMLESLSDGIITADLSGRIDYMNPVAIALTGRELEEARHQPIELIFQVIDPATRLPLPSLHHQVLTHKTNPRECRTGILLNHFGMTFSIQEAAALIRSERGEILGSIVVFRDLREWSTTLA